MASVWVDGSLVKASAPGTYETNVSVKKDEQRAVSVKATSKGGVVVESNPNVIGGQPTSVTIQMPAEVHVDVESGTAQEVRIGDDVFRGAELPISKQYVLAQGPKEVRFEARASDGVTDRRTLTLRPGELTELHVQLAFAARLRAPDFDLAFGKPYSFDGSLSTPQSSIRAYRWEFGDGTEAVQTTEPSVEHAFVYHDGIGKAKTYQVTLTAINRDGLESSETVAVHATLRQEPLEVSLETYPSDPILHRAGEALRFRVAPKKGWAPDDLVNIAFLPGDGTTITKDVHGAPLTIRKVNGDPRGFVVEHTYREPGRYAPKVRYGHKTTGLGGPFDAEQTGGGLELRMLPHIVTADELLEQARGDAYAQLSSLIRSLKLQQAGATVSPVVALSSLDDANFESKDKEFTQTLDRLTRRLVADGVDVVERSTPVLARLAPEAVVNIAEKAAGDISPHTDAYEPALEYGLVTSGGEGSKPLEYGIRIEGTNDRLLLNQVGQTLGTEESGRGKAHEASARDGGLGTSESAYEKARNAVHDELLAAARRNLPVIAARFDTANCLVAIRETEEKPDAVRDYSYSDELGESLALLTRTVLIDVRILDRRGHILVARQLEGRAEAEVPGSAVP